MSSYSRVHNFTAKDALAVGDANKRIKGSEVDAELNAVQTAINSKADSSTVTTLESDIDADINTLDGRIDTLEATYDNSIIDGRLTLTSGTAVTTSDVTAATTLYFTPHKGNRITLYDGSSAWNLYTFTELSIAVPATTATMYDVFVYNNAGTPTLELTSWTNDTTRATALTLQNGVLVKTGATTRRYVGSFRTTAVSGQTEDSIAKRYLWNYYNRVNRHMSVIEATNSWAYASVNWRQANNSAANQLDLVCGVAEDTFRAEVVATSAVTTNSAVGVGVDSTTVNSAIVFGNSGNADFSTLCAVYLGVPSAGRHYYPWLEATSNSGTNNFYGDQGSTTPVQSGIVGMFRM